MTAAKVKSVVCACPGCGYGLTILDIGGVCPRCGRLSEESVYRVRLAANDAAAWARFASGFRWAVWAAFAACLLPAWVVGLFAPQLTDALGWRVALLWVPQSALLFGHVVWCVALARWWPMLGRWRVAVWVLAAMATVGAAWIAGVGALDAWELVDLRALGASFAAMALAHALVHREAARRVAPVLATRDTAAAATLRAACRSASTGVWMMIAGYLVMLWAAALARATGDDDGTPRTLLALGLLPAVGGALWCWWSAARAVPPMLRTAQTVQAGEQAGSLHHAEGPADPSDPLYDPTPRRR